MELTILMPCLNEAETLETCIRKAQGYLSASGVDGEVLVADNGSTDGSREIAERCGARVADVPEKGYGAALIGGCEAARGKYVIMGDADDSYDFTDLDPFLEKLREGYQLVMGNRFKGGIEPGAMPPLHRYLGNPVLSFIGRLFYPSSIGDFHCGLRGYDREAILGLGLRTTGMEYASEMVVKATLYKLRITEVPTTLKKDGRSHPPHLRSFRDGWRHLKFLLMHSPDWLFLYPGIALTALGLVMMALLAAGPAYINGIALDVHTMLYGSAFTITGSSVIQFALFTKAYARTSGFIPVKENKKKRLTPDRAILFGALLLLAGLAATIAAFTAWRGARFGDLDPQRVMRLAIPAVTAMAVGTQSMFGGFFIGILEIPHKK